MPAARSRDLVDILKGLFGFLTGGATSAGGAVAELAALAALVASSTPAVIALFRERNEILFTVTVGQGGFLFLAGVFVVVIVRLAHRSPAP